MHGPTNPPVELARYTAGGQDRIVRGQRILGIVRLTDVPEPREAGRPYLIERGLTAMAEVDGIVADYLAQAAALDAVPACTGALDVEALRELTA